MTVQDGAQKRDVMEPDKRANGESSAQNASESNIPQEPLVIRDGADKLQVPSSYYPPVGNTRVAKSKDSEAQDSNGNSQSAGKYSSEPLDWEDFETRYSTAMATANESEAVLHKEFEELMSYFSTWATASSQCDDDRALKRLKTREAFVQHAEQSLEEKKKHYSQVVNAFKNALALLGGP